MNGDKADAQRLTLELLDRIASSLERLERPALPPEGATSLPFHPSSMILLAREAQALERIADALERARG